MELNYSDLVRAIDDQKRTRRQGPRLPVQRHRTRHALAQNLHRLAARLEG